MKLVESDYKYTCDECEDYTYVFQIETRDEDYHQMRLCKRCLLDLLKLIIER